jgi:hypothetical protein
LFFSGQFCVRRDVFDRVGGFAENVPHGENGELAMRLIPTCDQMGLEIASIPQPLVRRNLNSTIDYDFFRIRYEGASQIVWLQESWLRRDAEMLFRYLTVAGVSAMKIGRFAEGRAYLWKSLKQSPKRPIAWLRWGAAWMPPVSKMVWGLYRQ